MFSRKIVVVGASVGLLLAVMALLLDSNDTEESRLIREETRSEVLVPTSFNLQEAFRVANSAMGREVSRYSFEDGVVFRVITLESKTYAVATIPVWLQAENRDMLMSQRAVRVQITRLTKKSWDDLGFYTTVDGNNMFVFSANPIDPPITVTVGG